MNIKETLGRLARVQAELYSIRADLPYITDARTPKIAEQSGKARECLKEAWIATDNAIKELAK